MRTGHSVALCPVGLCPADGHAPCGAVPTMPMCPTCPCPHDNPVPHRALSLHAPSLCAPHVPVPMMSTCPRGSVPLMSLCPTGPCPCVPQPVMPMDPTCSCPHDTSVPCMSVSPRCSCAPHIPVPVMPACPTGLCPHSAQCLVPTIPVTPCVPMPVVPACPTRPGPASPSPHRPRDAAEPRCSFCIRCPQPLPSPSQSNPVPNLRKPV